MGTTRHFHDVFDVRVLGLNMSSIDVGTLLKIAQQKTAKTMKKKKFLILFPTYLP
jgi:hypothetical protein